MEAASLTQSPRLRFRSVLATAVIAGGILASAPVEAQPGSRAILGQPFGVARFSVPLTESGDRTLINSGSYRVIEQNDRIRYPAISTGQFAEAAAGFLSDAELGIEVSDLPGRLQVSFLFTDDEPLELTVFTPEPQQVRLVPEPPRRPRDHDRVFNRWWRDYNSVARNLQATGDYPPIVETYLTSMLAGRFGLRPPLLTRIQDEEPSEIENLVGLLLGVEDLRFALMRQTMAGGGGLGEQASIEMPAAVNWQPLNLPADVPQVEVEPIALHVPAECLYVRFGSFENYLWFDHLKDDYGGNLSQMVTLRGHNAGLDEKVQQQLALKQSAIAEVMGPQVIADVALIGRDLYLREGPAIGVLFEAKNSALLQTSFSGDRNAMLTEWKDRGATIETVTIAGHDVSFLSTPDNQLRSYYAVDGNFHLVTTSRAIVERFYAAGAGQDALGTSAEFLHARWQMPLEREDTLFAYLSSAFFANLLSPQYQIELTRRLQSVTDMELVQLAQLAATAEGMPHENVAELIAGGFLPRGFGQRGEGTPPVETQHGDLDPQRGMRGYFTPIPDMTITSITPTESQLYDRAAAFLQTNWPQFDPLMAGIKRYALDEERMERVVIDANVSPIAEEKYGWVLSMLGPPVDVQVQSDPTDVLTMQMSLKGGLLWPAIPAHQVFLGIQDLEPSIDPVPDGFLDTLQILRATPGYLGAWPQLGLLELLPFFNPQPDVFGFSQLPFGLWRWQGDGFSVLSFNHDVLAEAAGSLQPVPTDNPAQIQLRISDLAHSHLAGWVSMLNYNRAGETSLGNVQLLHTLSQQLRVSPQDALTLANELLDTRLVCALGGDYEFIATDDGAGAWRSTAWTTAGLAPPDYSAPLLEWFRGTTVHLTRQVDGMFLHAEIDMLRKEREPAVKLPSFNLFGGSDKSSD